MTRGVYLTELFASSEAQWITKDDALYVAELRLSPDVVYRFQFRYKGLRMWIYDFTLNHKGQKIDRITPGYGNPFQVIGAAVECIKSFVTERQPRTVYFLSNKQEPSRTKLYKAIATSVSSVLPDYRLETEPEDFDPKFIAFKLYNPKV